MIQEKPTSLNSRLNMLLSVCFIPMVALLLFVLAFTYRFSDRYDTIVSNITKANEYNLTFKEDIDYIMYIIVVNAERASELVDPEQPQEMITGAKEDFRQLEINTTDTEQKTLLQRILKSLDTLEQQIIEIRRDATIVGMYDTNLERLDLDIRIMTELIQEEIQLYISAEARHLREMRREVREDVERTTAGSLLLISIVVLIAIMNSRRILLKTTEGIRQLRMVSRKAGKGDFSIRAELENSDEELAELAEGFNQMVEKLGALVEDIKVEQLQLRLTEQKLLQAQINPHFLYNTLDAIIWLAEDGEKERVIEMVTALSDFFRTTLSKGRDFISVKEEESHIKSYLQIQQFRYQDILEYEITIPEELYEYQILKLVLQPLVENALYHGIKNKRGIGRISVSGEIQDNKLQFTVKDNGIGMTEERLRQIRRDANQDVHGNVEPEGFGLFNVAQRIRLYYGVGYELEIDSVYGEGTEVRVIVPANKN